MVFANKRLTEIVEKECGCGAINKHISSTLLKLPKDKLKKIIEGYVSGDGSVCAHKTRIQTVSLKLAVSIQLALAKVYGIVGGLHCHKNPPTCVIEGRTVKQQPFSYIVEWRDSKTPRHRSIYCGDHLLVPLKSIESNNIDMVYNLEVAEDNSYTANGVCVHNCQNLSQAGNGKGLEGDQSKLFFKFVEALNIIKPKYFLLENVKMKKEWQDIMSSYVGVEPIEINSALVSAQRRKRLYWTNIPNIILPEDKGILLKDIIHENIDNMSRKDLEPYIINPSKAITILENESKNGKIGYIGIDSQGTRIYNVHGKSVTLMGNSGGLGGKTGLYLFGCITPDRLNKRQNGQRFNDGEKFYTLTAIDQHGILTDGYIRKLTPVECERLQTVPEGYTDVGISNNARYKALGNGWTVDVISHILSSIPAVSQDELF
jgi:DNA (cytosine-5)-methyltransferase 3A